LSPGRGSCRPGWRGPLRRTFFLFLEGACVRFASPNDGWCALSPGRAVLFILRLDRTARLGEVGIGPVAQLIEVPAHRQCLDAVHGDGLAIDPVAATRNQEYREVLQLFHLAD